MALAESIFYMRFIFPSVLSSLYTDLPNILKSIKGKRHALTDVFVQSIKDKYSSLRIHLRASGTEDLIRIYAEGEDRKKLEEAVEEITRALSEIE